MFQPINETTCYLISFSIITNIIILNNDINILFILFISFIFYNNIKDLYNSFKIIIKKSYEIILVIILSEIIKDFEDLYKTDYIFSIYNEFKIIIIIKKSYEIIKNIICNNQLFFLLFLINCNDVVNIASYSIDLSKSFLIEPLVDNTEPLYNIASYKFVDNALTASFLLF